jgi:hypothetical protein
MENWEGGEKGEQEDTERREKLKENIGQWNCHIATGKAKKEKEPERQTRAETAKPDREEAEIPKS